MLTKLETSSQLTLLQRGKYLSDNKIVWDSESLTCEQNWHERDKPYEYLKLQADILKVIGGGVIVEIGSVRQPMNHDINTIDPACCTDGHSTFFWAETENEVHTVDIVNYGNIMSAIKNKHPNTFNAYVGDGVVFLEQFSKKIDFLFLDAWDVVPGTQYAEEHLRAFNAAKDKLAEKHIIGIDDTDIYKGGKGRLLVPHLKQLGYSVITDGRQTIFVNFDLNEKE